MMAGWSRQDLAVVPRGFGMQGYGKWHQRDTGQKTPLYARAIAIGSGEGAPLIICCLDLGYVTHAMREGICTALHTASQSGFDADRFVLTCTHTHSGPGGCTHDIMYNLVTPGFVPAYLARIVSAAATAIQEAVRSMAAVTITLQSGRFADGVDVAWNRSLAAYNRNPDVVPRRKTETHLALDRDMQVLAFSRCGRVEALLSLFGVHATCIGSSNTLYDGDNKGYAASFAEGALREKGAAAPVAIFAQATAGDVSPHYHGPGQNARRNQFAGQAEYAYAARNGRLQAERALSIVCGGHVADADVKPGADVSAHSTNYPESHVRGNIDAVFGYFDFRAITADPRFADGRTDAVTSEPCHGAAFFAGTPVDGPGLPKAILWAVTKIAAQIKRRRLRNLARYNADDRTYYTRLYQAQGPKAIMQEAGRKVMLGQTLDRISIPDFVDPAVAEIKRQARIGAMHRSAMVPTVLPLQIVTIGNLALVCAPGEFTTAAGARLRAGIAADLQPRGITRVLLCTYCNDYMGYVTTFAEYQQQAYEGGHTIFGQWTLAAFQTCFAKLTGALSAPPGDRAHDRVTKPVPVPAGELALRTAP